MTGNSELRGMARPLRGAPGMRWDLGTGLGGRLVLTFGAIVVVFGAASAFAMFGMVEVHDTLHLAQAHTAGVAAAQGLASAVRDQYAHQAHTIVLGNDTHLGYYEDARRRVADGIAETRRHAEDQEERAWLDQIEAESQTLDQLFKAKIVPAVLAHDQAQIIAEHARAQVLVNSIQNRADRLAKRLLAAAEGSDAHATFAEHIALRWSAVLLLGATLLAAGLGGLLFRSITRPVRALEAGAARIAAGDLKSAIDLPGHDELAELGRSLDAMTRSLREHQQRVVDSERLAGIGRLAAGVAHEINNPLTVILGYVRLLEKRAGESERADLQVIAAETRRCQEIVEGLLDLSRPLAQGQAPIELGPLSAELADRLAESGPFPRGHFELEGDGSAYGHPAKIRQVLLNLLKNASEAAGPEGRVWVRIRSGAERITWEVEDTGPGLSPEAMARLFEPFYTTKGNGTGLGLAVSKAIVDAHGGTLLAENLPTGARFALTLPRPGDTHG